MTDIKVESYFDHHSVNHYVSIYLDLDKIHFEGVSMGQSKYAFIGLNPSDAAELAEEILAAAKEAQRENDDHKARIEEYVKKRDNEN